MTAHSQGVVEATKNLLDDLEVGPGRMRDVVLELADLVDHPDSPGHMAVASAALASARQQLREMYKKRSVLEQELDILRGQRHVRELKERGDL